MRPLFLSACRLSSGISLLNKYKIDDCRNDRDCTGNKNRRARGSTALFREEFRSNDIPP